MSIGPYPMLGVLLALVSYTRAFGAEVGHDIVCPDNSLDAVLAAAMEVERSFLELDDARFDLARHRMGSLMVCVETPMRPEDAVQLHRARAFVAFADKDLDATERAFAAVHALQPEWSLDPSAIPTSHPLWRIYESAVDDDEDPRTLPLTATPEHGWSIDGTRYPLVSDTRDEAGQLGEDYSLPADRAFVLQAFGPKGEVTYTGYHFSPSNIPLTDLVVLPDPGAIRRRARKGSRLAGSIVGAALLGGAGVTFALGWKDRQGFEDRSVAPGDAYAVQRRANLLGGASTGLAGAGALAFAVTWAVPW